MGASRSMDVIDALASEKRQGELDSIKNIPAFVMSRLQNVIAGGVVVPGKAKGHNTVLMAQAPPRGASAHARYLAASMISARQDGRTVLAMRRVFAVSPRSALCHSNLATCFG